MHRTAALFIVLAGLAGGTAREQGDALVDPIRTHHDVAEILFREGAVDLVVAFELLHQLEGVAHPERPERREGLDQLRHIFPRTEIGCDRMEITI